MKVELIFDERERKKILISPKKETEISVEVRCNHLQKKDKNGEPILHEVYIVIRTDKKIKPYFFRTVNWVATGLQVIETPEGLTEISGYYNSTFIPLLVKLEEKNILSIDQISLPKEKGKYPMYINPKGWQFLYNFTSQLRGFCYRMVNFKHL